MAPSANVMQITGQVAADKLHYSYGVRKLSFMQRLRDKLPPPNHLVTFEAAGRRLSFTKAASELNVSRVAVSQQIQALERFLGVSLFERSQRSIRLTRVGERYHASISDALDRALRATMDICKRLDSSIVNVGTTPGFMTYWLLPRLGEFRATHPDIELRFIVSDGSLGFEENIDLAIRYGSPPFDDAEATYLDRQEISPTCATTYLPAGASLTPADLMAHRLIHLEGPYDEQTRWDRWFRTLGFDTGRARPGITVNSYTNLVQAALDGQGFALIGPPLITRFLLTGALIQPVNVPPIARHAFHLVVPRGERLSNASELFADWIKAAFSRETTHATDVRNPTISRSAAHIEDP